MPELLLAAFAVAGLVWCLLCTVRQQHGCGGAEPGWLWRQALADGWSDWIDLHGVSPLADYETVLGTVRSAAHPQAIAVQFAAVARPAGAPDHTRVVFASAVRDMAGRRV